MNKALFYYTEELIRLFILRCQAIFLTNFNCVLFLVRVLNFSSDRVNLVSFFVFCLTSVAKRQEITQEDNICKAYDITRKGNRIQVGRLYHYTSAPV